MNKVLFEMFVSKCTLKFTIGLFQKGSSYVTELVTHFIYSLSLYILQFNHFVSNPSKLTRHNQLFVSVPLKRQAASVVRYLSLPLLNSINKTEAAYLPMKAMLRQDYSFLSEKFCTVYRIYTVIRFARKSSFW